MCKVKAGKCLLRKVLRRYGMRQQDLADRLNMSTAQVSRYSNGKQGMTLDTAVSIARAIGCRVEDLYEWIPSD
ncbi:helix-turn-helix domain-containing protein [Aneurinibacillus aneurinilyticus]|jgi:plasmid maintenance system antidote protein VapI|uniref:Helix-turn-helix transcriptional regulator n=1 Tax=Aneurinibacillus aneurinilyticus TaxID=1391 RepID=A0A848CRF5_ANEAE|nr:helix-turn-helix transcriptional regulator [Aneurinibacillus aneurinilyticus]NMF00045.1 helix-turn-helix transcriptional regulator [Aneurinibacillus aneurinilyticus]